MHFRSIVLALLLSGVAGVVLAGTAKPPAGHYDHPAPTTNTSERQYVDCHRDVRTHWIFGALIRHRHVGKDCAVREVKKMKSF